MIFENNSGGKQGKSLASLLWKLANYIRAQVVEAKANNKIIQVSDTYVRPKFQKFEYGDQGNIASRYSTEYFEKAEWHWKHQHDFIQATLKSAPEFDECAKLLKLDSSNNARSHDGTLYQFARKVAFLTIEGLRDEGIVELVSNFLGDLNNAPMEIQISAWIEGIWLIDEEVDLSTFKLRRPTKEDFEVERSLSSAIYAHPSIDGMGFVCPAILDFSIHAPSTLRAQEEVMEITNVLRLFRLGSVRELKYSVSPNSILRPHFVAGSPRHTSAPYKYALSRSDGENLQQFFSQLKPLVPSDLGTSQTAKKPEDLAFLRFSDAVLAGGAIESRITAAITCLEALYLKGEERSELSHKLSLRAASLLRLLKLNALEVQAQIHRAYEIRSTHIHGGQVEKERLKDGTRLCRDILEYARFTVLIFLQLKGKVEKDEFINKLDRALLETKSLERVERSLEELIIPR
ncbi:MAG TPA: hypothetical protein VN873_14705 [Candidatus Angelobacter sp.]|nr:hypothetical protein [Candidatus Angelobacter sp.]